MISLRIATRKSALALWQANWVAGQLMQTHPSLRIELVEITTEGDRRLDLTLSKIGGKGLFLKELEEALLRGEADIAVHSLKDVPAQDRPGLQLSAFLPRANPLDALVSSTYPSLASLPHGATVGTASLRRQSQILHLRPDLRILPLRGNVDTRLRRQQTGDFDAIILAACGLERLNLSTHLREALSPDLCLPAVGQGIVVVQSRAEDEHTQALIKALHSPASYTLALAERSMNALLGGSCQVPVAGYATLHGTELRLNGLVGRPDGQTLLKATYAGDPSEAQAIGQRVAESLLAQGAQTIINEALAGKP
jgi:hydroxymethylbilane synthase